MVTSLASLEELFELYLGLPDHSGRIGHSAGPMCRGGREEYRAQLRLCTERRGLGYTDHTWE